MIVSPPLFELYGQAVDLILNRMLKPTRRKAEQEQPDKSSPYKWDPVRFRLQPEDKHTGSRCKC